MLKMLMMVEKIMSEKKTENIAIKQLRKSSPSLVKAKKNKVK